MLFTLTATTPGSTLSRTFTADDSTDATFEAIRFIMDSAAVDKSGPWARGAIALVDSAGTVLQAMEAK